MPAEQLNTHEIKAVPAAEVLYKPAEIYNIAENAIDQGLITIEPYFNNPESWPDLYVGIPTTKDEIEIKENAYFYQDGSAELPLDQFEWKSPESAEKEAKAVHEKLKERLAYDIKPWYLDDPLIADLVDHNGRLSQAFEFRAGEKKLQMLNFSQHSLSSDQLGKMEETLKQVVSSAGVGVMDSVAGIAIVDHVDLNDSQNGKEDFDAIGMYRNYNQVLLLSDKLLWDDSLETDKYGMDVNATRLQSTFAHELGHAAQNFYHGIFDNALQWSTTNESSNPFEVNPKENHNLGEPNSIQTVFRDGKLVDVAIEEHFDKEDLKNVGPNTSYGATQGMEDFAESAVPYFIEGRQTDKIDPIRSNAISTTLQQKYVNADMEYGPYVVEATEVDIDQLKSELPSIQKQHLKVQVIAKIAANKE